MLVLTLTVASAVLWLALLLAPWQPWRARPVLDTAGPPNDLEIADITVVIPARNEAEVIETTLRGLLAQDLRLQIIVVDDRSRDGTREQLDRLAESNLTVIDGQPLPAGWSGKLWALEQGRSRIATDTVLLLDADIELRPGIIAAAYRHMRRQDIQLLSLMALPRMAGLWSKLLMPAFVFFFQLLYPFERANDPTSTVAAAAGGFVLIETRVINDIGGFGGLREVLIDDCALAAKAKTHGYRTWLGLTRSAFSRRRCDSLKDIWRMVERTAFTQLGYSGVRLSLCTALMILAFWVPLMGLLAPPLATRLLAAGALLMMMLSYGPTLRFNGRSFIWALALPAIGLLYLAMTWTSAIHYWRGARAQWKDRIYPTGT